MKDTHVAELVAALVVDIEGDEHLRAAFETVIQKYRGELPEIVSVLASLLDRIKDDVTIAYLLCEWAGKVPDEVFKARIHRLQEQTLLLRLFVAMTINPETAERRRAFSHLIFARLNASCLQMLGCEVGTSYQRVLEASRAETILLTIITSCLYHDERFSSEHQDWRFKAWIEPCYNYLVTTCAAVYVEGELIKALRSSVEGIDREIILIFLTDIETLTHLVDELTISHPTVARACDTRRKALIAEYLRSGRRPRLRF